MKLFIHAYYLLFRTIKISREKIFLFIWIFGYFLDFFRSQNDY